MVSHSETMRSVVQQFNKAVGSVNDHATLAAEQAHSGSFDLTTLTPDFLKENPALILLLTRAFIGKHGNDEDIIPSHATEEQITEMMLSQIERIRQKTEGVLQTSIRSSA